MRVPKSPGPQNNATVAGHVLNYHKRIVQARAPRSRASALRTVRWSVPPGGSSPRWRQKCHAYSTRPYRDTSHEAFPRLTTPHPSPLSSRCSKATDSSVQTPPIALARRCSEEQPQPACASRTHVSQHMEHAEKDVQHDARPRMSGLKGRHDEWRQTVVELSSLQLLCLHFATARLRWRKSCTRRTTS